MWSLVVIEIHPEPNSFSILRDTSDGLQGEGEGEEEMQSPVLELEGVRQESSDVEEGVGDNVLTMESDNQDRSGVGEIWGDASDLSIPAQRGVTAPPPSPQSERGPSPRMRPISPGFSAQGVPDFSPTISLSSPNAPSTLVSSLHMSDVIHKPPRDTDHLWWMQQRPEAQAGKEEASEDEEIGRAEAMSDGDQRGRRSSRTEALGGRNERESSIMSSFAGW